MESADKMIEDKLKLAHNLISDLESVINVSGVSKLEKKIRQEIKFLQKLQKQKKAGKVEDHLKCTNLLHLGAIVQTLIEADKPTAVLKAFNSVESCRKIVVDVVASDGFLWIKVIARNARALEQHTRGDQAFGQRSILDQASDWISCADENKHLFHVPQVRFVFHGGITEKLKTKMEQRGVKVSGEIKQVGDEDLDSEDDECDASDDDDVDKENETFASMTLPTSNAMPSVSSANAYSNVSPLSTALRSSTLNLDITAMIAFVSALTNGACNVVFKEPILSQQAEWERMRPAKIFLEKIFQGKRLICCQSASTDFRSIIDTLGGEGEKQRSKILFEQMIDEIVPDEMSERLKCLDLSGKIKARSRAIFGTGDFLQVVTVSANSGFVRAAQGQGINLAVIIHESRALTEGKMPSAVPLNKTE